MARVIMHIDLNAFFVRCEEIKNPELVGKPVLIGNTGRAGIVSTASYAARKMGCHSGQPMFQALEKCPKAIVIPGDHRFYSLMSQAFLAYLSRYSDKIEQASIDEAYVDMTAALTGVGDVEKELLSLQQGLYRETQLYCSIGIAPTKWLAKMGSDLKKPNGLTFVRKKDIEKIIYPLPIESFWGIGKKSAPRLRSMGIATIGDLGKRISSNDQALLSFFGKYYYQVKAELSGNSSDEVVSEEEDPKSIGNSETLLSDQTDESKIFPVIARLSESVSKRAKAQGLVGRGVTLSVKDTLFHLHSGSTMLGEDSNETRKINEAAIKIYEEKFAKSIENGMAIRLVGVSLTHLSDPKKANVQMSLWNYEQYEEMDKTKLLIAELNNKLDKPSLLKASDLKGKKK